ncbi:MAG: 2-thiouracil desulfurase family protein [Oscillospiraceae bacterium]
MTNIYIVSHCVLNIGSKVKHVTNEDYEREENSRKRFLEKIISSGGQLIQLPCPEFLLLGAKRNGHARCQFDNPFFKQMSRDILKPYIMQIEEYIQNSSEYNICGIVGINGSPSCGIDFSYDAYSPEGEAEISQTKKPFSNQSKGVFMEILEQMLNEKGIEIEFLAINSF